MRPAVGIDLGASKVRVALVEPQGGVMSETVFPVGGDRGPKSLVERIRGGVEEVLKEAALPVEAIEGVGIGCAGQISPDGRKVLFGPNLDWRDIPLADMLEDELRRVVILENDVRAAALGEALLGAGRGFTDLICVFVGSGVGAGIIIGGRPLRGASNLAGEVGHIKLDPHGPPCSCGGQGCLEVYAGGTHVSRRVREALESGKKSSLAEARELHVRAVEEAARRGDPLAMEIWDQVVRALGLGISNLVTIFNPAMVIMGGGVIEASPALIPHVRDAIQRWVTMLSGKEVQVAKAQLGARAPAIGASRLLFRHGA